MAETQAEREFEELHSSDFEGLIRTYGGWKEIPRSRVFVLPLIISTILGILLPLIASEKFIEIAFIQSIVDVSISVLGTLVGLSLAGLTLVVAFGNESLIAKMIRISLEDDLSAKTGKISSSIYQSTIAKFAMAVFVQVVSLIVFVLVKLGCISEIIIYWRYAMVVNVLVFFLLVFLMLYSLGMLFQMVLNVFTIGQQQHAMLLDQIIEDIETDIEKKKK